MQPMIYTSNEKFENIVYSSDVPNVILSMGVAGAGKTTWAKHYLSYLFARGVTGIRANRDDFRTEMFGDEYHTKSPVAECEAKVTKHQRSIIKEAIELNVPVIIDDCNINDKFRNDLIQFIYSINSDTNVVIVQFDTLLETCLKYNRQRERVVPDYIIKNMHQKFQAQKMLKN